MTNLLITKKSHWLECLRVNSTVNLSLDSCVNIITWHLRLPINLAPYFIKYFYTYIKFSRDSWMHQFFAYFFLHFSYNLIGSCLYVVSVFLCSIVFVYSEIFWHLRKKIQFTCMLTVVFYTKNAILSKKFFLSQCRNIKHICYIITSCFKHPVLWSWIKQ